MAKYISWHGFGVRELHGFIWEDGQVVRVEDEEMALDILTQPGEDFREVEEPGEAKAEAESGTKSKKGKSVSEGPAEEL